MAVLSGYVEPVARLARKRDEVSERTQVDEECLQKRLSDDWVGGHGDLRLDRQDDYEAFDLVGDVDLSRPLEVGVGVLRSHRASSHGRTSCRFRSQSQRSAQRENRVLGLGLIDTRGALRRLS